MILIKGKLYDVLKYLALIVLPALGTLYFTLSGLWGLPAGEQVVGTIVAVDAFLGVILQLSSTAYNRSDAKYDGAMVVHTNGDTGKKTVTLELNADPHESGLTEKDELRFKTVDVEKVRKIMTDKKRKAGGSRR